MVIYFDILLAVNWLVDYFLLLLSAHFLRLPVKRFRFLLGGFAGAAASLTIFLPESLSVLAAVLNFVSSVLIVWIAYGCKNWRLLLRGLLGFYGMSLIFAGAMTALWYFAAPKGLLVKNRVVYYNISPITFILFTLVIYTLLQIGQRLTARRGENAKNADLLVEAEGRKIILKGIVDTGNSLIDQMSGKPVVVAEYRAVEALLPEKIRPVFDGSGKAVPEECEDWKRRFRLIPFSAVAVQGLLPAFRTDMTVTVAGVSEKKKDIYLAVCNQKLSEGEFQALVPPEVAGELFPVKKRELEISRK